jgi:hypothetical protein
VCPDLQEMSSAATTAKMAEYHPESPLNPNNLDEIEEMWDIELRHEFGPIGGFIKNEYYVKVKPEIPTGSLLRATDETTMASAAYKLEYEGMKAVYSSVAKTNEDNKEKRHQMFAWMMMRISSTAKDHLVRDAAGEKILLAGNDPKELWLLIEEHWSATLSGARWPHRELRGSPTDCSVKARTWTQLRSTECSSPSMPAWRQWDARRASRLGRLMSS